MFFEDITFSNGNNEDNDLLNITDSFMLGNSFKNEYDGYKDYSVNYLASSNEKGNLLLKIYELDFAMNDLSLYLDIHPEDEVIYNRFRSITEDLNDLVIKYEKKYGPLELCDSLYTMYKWVEGKWPFEGGNI